MENDDYEDDFEQRSPEKKNKNQINSKLD